MTPESAQTLEPSPAGMSEISRLTGVFFEPKKAFQDIAARPRFIVPMVLMILASFAFTMAISQRIGWDRVIRHSMETSGRSQNMTPEQREQGVAMGMKIASFTSYGGALLAVPIYDLIVAGALLGIVAGIMSAPVRFKQVFAIVCYAGLPAILFTILGIIVMFMKNPDDFNIQNPLMFNPGSFMDPASSSKFVYSIASSLDLFTIWTLFLTAIGIKAAAGKKLSFGGALFAVILPWGIWVVIKAVFAGIFQ